MVSPVIVTFFDVLFLQLKRSPAAADETNAASSIPPCLPPNKSTLLANAKLKPTPSLSRLFLVESHPSRQRRHLPSPPKIPWIASPRNLGPHQPPLPVAQRPVVHSRTDQPAPGVAVNNRPIQRVTANEFAQVAGAPALTRLSCCPSQLKLQMPWFLSGHFSPDSPSLISK